MSDTNIHNRPNRPYKLLPYDPNWKVLFDKVVADLTPIFGENLIKIEHIGSTSVPGMLAKPQIDLIISVKDLELVKSFYEKLAEQGFIALGDYLKKAEPEEYFIKNNDDGERAYSVHVKKEGDPEIHDLINFRDYLRENSEARDLYIAHKQKLMNEFGDQDYNSYGKGKVNFLEELKLKAREWGKNK